NCDVERETSLCKFFVSLVTEPEPPHYNVTFLTLECFAIAIITIGIFLLLVISDSARLHGLLMDIRSSQSRGAGMAASQRPNAIEAGDCLFLHSQFSATGYEAELIQGLDPLAVGKKQTCPVGEAACLRFHTCSSVLRAAPTEATVTPISFEFQTTTAFVVDEVSNIVKEAIESAIGGNAYQHSKVNQWTTNVVEQTLSQLTKLGKPFKYIVTCVIMQKNGAGLHTASSCFWDSSTDGSCTVRWENKTMYCIVSAFGLSI
ncbi:hypothetical protein EI555_011255, partial [Monodon monoceros]